MISCLWNSTRVTILFGYMPEFYLSSLWINLPVQCQNILEKLDKYPTCWCPGFLWCQVISSHSIDPGREIRLPKTSACKRLGCILSFLRYAFFVKIYWENKVVNATKLKSLEVSKIVTLTLFNAYSGNKAVPLMDFLCHLLWIHSGWHNMAAILLATFSNSFSSMQYLYFDSSSTEIFSQCPN